eukprot:1842481-Rhodomonas_salina.1
MQNLFFACVASINEDGIEQAGMNFWENEIENSAFETQYCNVQELSMETLAIRSELGAARTVGSGANVASNRTISSHCFNIDLAFTGGMRIISEDWCDDGGDDGDVEDYDDDEQQAFNCTDHGNANLIFANRDPNKLPEQRLKSKKRKGRKLQQAGHDLELQAAFTADEAPEKEQAGCDWELQAESTAKAPEKAQAERDWELQGESTAAEAPAKSAAELGLTMTLSEAHGDLCARCVGTCNCS